MNCRLLLTALVLAAATTTTGQSQWLPVSPYSQNGLISRPSTVQVVVSSPGGITSPITHNANAPGAVSGEGGALANTTPAVTWPAAGTIAHFRASWSAVITAVGTMTITVYQNGTSSVVTCTILQGSNQCADLTDTLTVSAGDYFQVTYSDTGTVPTGALSFSMDFTPTTTNNVVVMMGATAWNATTEEQQFMANYGGSAATSSGISQSFGESGTISDLYVTMASGGPGGTASYAFADRLNGTDGAITCTVTGTATTCNDTTHSASVSAGNTLSVSATPTGTPTAAVPTGLGLVFVPTTSGNFEFNKFSTAGDSTSLVNYHPIQGVVSAGAVEANEQTIVNSMTFTSFKVTLIGAPGTSNSRTFTLMDNGTPTSASCVISGSALTCTWTGAIQVAGGDLVDISDTPVGPPGNTGLVTINTIAHK